LGQPPHAAIFDYSDESAHLSEGVCRKVTTHSSHVQRALESEEVAKREDVALEGQAHSKVEG
jgi:hypothetical protein